MTDITKALHKQLKKIAADTFRANMPASVVFLKLAEWEKTFKIKSSDKAVFVKEEDVAVLSSCILDMPKELKTLVAFCGNEDYRPNLKGVFIDFDNSSIVATDTYILNVMEMDIIENNGMQNIIVESKLMKSVAGKRCTIEILDCQADNVRITTDNGDVFTGTTIAGRFPEYKRVLPKVNRDGLFQLSKESVKEFCTFAKSIAKRGGTKKGETPRDPITISVDAYSGTMTAVYHDPNTLQTISRKFAVVGSSRINIRVNISAFLLTTLTKDWDGCIWFTDKNRPVVFDLHKSRCAIVMPVQCSENSDSCNGNIDALDRHGVTPTPKAISTAPEYPIEENADITPLITTICNVVESIQSALMIVKIECCEYTRIDIIPMLDMIYGMTAKLSAILMMCAKASEIEEIASLSGIPTHGETSSELPPDEPTPIEPPTKPKDSMEPTAPIIGISDDPPVSSAEVSPPDAALISYYVTVCISPPAPPGAIKTLRAPPKTIKLIS